MGSRLDFELQSIEKLFGKVEYCEYRQRAFMLALSTAHTVQRPLQQFVYWLLRRHVVFVSWRFDWRRCS